MHMLQSLTVEPRRPGPDQGSDGEQAEASSRQKNGQHRAAWKRAKIMVGRSAKRLMRRSCISKSIMLGSRMNWAADRRIERESR